jgi:hypothetical protein
MSKLEDSAKGEKSSGVMIYEPPYMFTRVTCPDGHLFRRVEICFPHVRWCERCTGYFLVVTRLLDLCCEMSKDIATRIKMEEGLPIRYFRRTNQTTSMMYFG